MASLSVTPGILERVANDARLRELLQWPFDFELLDESSKTPAGQVEGGDGWYPIGGDGAGNTFGLLGRTRNGEGAMLYVCHEGQAGVIANSIGEGLQLMVAVPYWRDLLKFSRGGQLPEMRRVGEILENEIRGRSRVLMTRGERFSRRSH